MPPMIKDLPDIHLIMMIPDSVRGHQMPPMIKDLPDIHLIIMIPASIDAHQAPPKIKDLPERVLEPKRNKEAGAPVLLFNQHNNGKNKSEEI